MRRRYPDTELFNSEKRKEKREERKAVKAKLKEEIKPRETFAQRQEKAERRKKKLEENERIHSAVSERLQAIHSGAGHENVVQLGSELLYVDSLSDIRLQITDQLNDGGKTYSRWTVHAKHAKDFLGMAPTNREVEFGGISITFTDDDDKVVQELHCFDMVALLQQIQAP